ncbi:protein obstructor-E-like [Anopheles marshallii]|uniref:protein obstructor-E-like n=1 Tax=Anopheles marshallii TaxID=1521116 RepID=UPI00237BBB46|nr:protein obstructor-E-like [Anopheles marshallii]
MKLLFVLLALGGVCQLNGFKICERKAPGTIMGNPANCSEFYMCRSGRPVLFSCPDNMYFDVDSAACGYEAFCTENDVNLDVDPLEPFGPEYSPIVADRSRLVPNSGVCLGASAGAIRLDTTGCKSFFQCTKAGPLRLECPAGTLFDSNRILCDPADIVSCAFAPANPIVGGPVTSNILSLLCHGKKNGHKLAHPTNCERYIVCNGRNKPQELKCPSGTAYNKKRNICDFKHNVEC